MLVFVMALQSAEASKDWGRVSKLCERALRSICNQTSQAFRVFLVCNQRPAMTFAHPAICLIEEDFPQPEPSTASRMRDKWRKVKRGLIAAREFAPAHVMIADADDCVHRELAAFVERHPDALGWSFKKGFMHDEGSRWLYRVHDFDIRCGTSAIVRLKPGEIPSSMEEVAEDYFILSHGHGEIDVYFREKGTPLAELPFSGAIYMTATGENDSRVAVRDWRGKKILVKKLLTARPLTKRLREEFSLYDL